MIAILGNGDINGGKNIDGSRYTKELQKRLVESYNYLLERGAYLSNMFPSIDLDTEPRRLMKMEYEKALLPILPILKDYDREIDFNILHNRPLTKELHDFYMAIKELPRGNKLFIGPQKLEKVGEILNCPHYKISDIDAIKELKSITSYVGKHKIYLFSAGMASKVFIAELQRRYPKSTFIDLGSAFDPLVGQTRTGQCTTEEIKAFYGLTPSIPKKIWTAWLSKNPMPENIKKIIETQKIPGYKHEIITLDNLPVLGPGCGYSKDVYYYLQQALKAKKWVKAVDLIRFIVLGSHGGIFLDADMEILEGKNFDDMLNCPLFTGREENGFLGISIVGSIPHHPLIEKHLKVVPEKWRGDDDQEFQSSMENFTVLSEDYLDQMVIYAPHYFYPYNHATGIIKVEDYTVCFHHFLKSWADYDSGLPTVSILIPHLGREEGLKRCLLSIDKLYYPMHQVEIIVDKGKGTVPQKVERMLRKAKGEYICYAANDMYFTPNSLYTAIRYSLDQEKALVSFNEGPLLPDKGNIATHFIIRKDFIPEIGGQIFSTQMTHCGVDNLLWTKASKKKQAAWCEDAHIVHEHFSKTGKTDKIYEKGWKNVEEDRKILKRELAKI